MMAGDADFLRPLVRSVIQEFLEAEMATAIGAEKGERVEGRLSYRSGYYPRSLITRVGLNCAVNPFLSIFRYRHPVRKFLTLLPSISLEH